MKLKCICPEEVVCTGKGKEHKKYEFGNKESIIRSWQGHILGALSFRNEYDGHTIAKSLEQVKRLTGKAIKKPVGDRGYRGVKQINETEIMIPDTPKPRTVTIKDERNTSFSVNEQVFSPP